MLFETSTAEWTWFQPPSLFGNCRENPPPLRPFHRAGIRLQSGYCAQSVDGNVLRAKFNRFRGLMKVGSKYVTMVTVNLSSDKDAVIFC